MNEEHTDVGSLAHELYEKLIGAFKPGARADATDKPAKDFLGHFKYEQGKITDPKKLEGAISYTNALAGIAYLGGKVSLGELTKDEKARYAEVGSTLMEKMDAETRNGLILNIQEAEVEQIQAKYANAIRDLNNPKIKAAKAIQNSEGPVLLGVLRSLSNITHKGSIGDTMKQWYGNLGGYLQELGTALRYAPQGPGGH